ncbi:hypothetical protein B0T10DRAFT_548779 [Thelonectria olida]|uniref:Uncharacterized protein n=1 Tax=Thelonectria olida TaxID=1576542 RepID=A0A9P8W6Q6_9HYPO|nr:hypothetical protein B0T10DRAFT_548779 [Thelonectria olida]
MSDNKNQGSPKSRFWRKPLNRLNRKSQPATSTAYQRPDTNLFGGPYPPNRPEDPQPPNDYSALVEPPQVRAYNLAFSYSPAPSTLKRVEFRHPTVVDSVQLAGIREEEQPLEQGAQAETPDTSPHGNEALPSPTLPENREGAGLVNQVDMAPPESGPKPPLSITINPAETVSSSTPHSDEDIISLIAEYWRNIESLTPPVPKNHLSSPLNSSDATDGHLSVRPALQQTDTVEHEATTAPGGEIADIYDINKPTCSLNLVCYRSGAAGCDLQQLHCILHSKFSSNESFLKMTTANPHMIATDCRFFQEMRQVYETKMCGFFRRYFSLKSLRAFRILVYAPSKRPTVVPLDDFVLQEMMYAYRNPGKLGSDDDWIQWVFRLRGKDRRHALEFVEGWNTTRIAVAGTIPWLSSCLVGISWTAAGGDAQTAFTVASFILTSSSIVLALLAIISGIESSGRTIS